MGERRGAILRELGAQGVQARTAEEACINAAFAIEKYGKDIPFALLYLIDEKGTQASLAASAGVEHASYLAAPVIPLERSSA